MKLPTYRDIPPERLGWPQPAPPEPSTQTPTGEPVSAPVDAPEPQPDPAAATQPERRSRTKRA